MKILVGSPVCQKPEILEAFLMSLEKLNSSNMRLDYFFVDDNKEEKSSQQLALFKREQSMIMVEKGEGHSSYVCDESSHYWNDYLMHRVAKYKNKIIQYAIDNHYDALFFADSDLVLHPDLIIHLVRQKKDIVSEIFWSQWHPGQELEPNVWLFDEYDLIPKGLGEELSIEEKEIRKNDFLKMLKTPGLYEVGGLGACTLLSRAALLKGVNFAPISNLTIHGEDRFFCIRAAVLGIKLFVDTSCPAYHIYREKDLSGISNYINECKQIRLRNKVTLSMIVKNEEKRYLSRVLKCLIGHIDEAVIIDDCSNDCTVDICKKSLAGIPLHFIENKESMFANEISLRKLQWDETLKTSPEWILSLDADEVLEEGFWKEFKIIMRNQKSEKVLFHLYDMWNETQYREDSFWNAHQKVSPFLLYYHPDFQYEWKEAPQHCGRFPYNCGLAPRNEVHNVQNRIQHFGWATPEDRLDKYKRYMKLDPGAVYGIAEQYHSILDENPTLIDWLSHE